MPLCPDCFKNDKRLSIMIKTGEEAFKGSLYVVLECIECGSTIRLRRTK